jgi:hypothetical protein
VEQRKWATSIMAKYKKGSYVVIPNKEILRGKKAAFQSIYFWICEHANENGTCYPGRTRLADEAGVDIKTVDKYLQEMVSIGLLSVTNRFKKNSKEKDTNLYQIMVVEEEEVLPKTEVPTPENGWTGSPENGAVTQSIRTQSNNNTSETSSVPFKWEEKRDKMMEKEGSDMDIIATFLEEKKLIPKNSAELTGYIKRYRKIAQDIVPFVGSDFKRFWKAIEICKEESFRLGYDWKLETVYKKITTI